ncbi:MAG: hypothetical protein V1724_08310 [Chloroflexota bacterium]
MRSRNGYDIPHVGQNRTITLRCPWTGRPVGWWSVTAWPWHVAASLTLYILTQDPAWVTKLEMARVAINYEYDSSSDPGAFTVSVKGIDEFITQEDWDRLWTQYVRPRQESLLQQQGMKPQGRRTVEIGRLRKALPGYCKMVQRGLTMKDILGLPSSVPEPPDQETIRRAIRDLKELLSPRP